MPTSPNATEKRVGGSWGLRLQGVGGGPAPAGGCESPGAPTDSGRGASADQPSPRVPTETLARAREPGTPNFGPRDAPPRHLRFHLRAPGPRPTPVRPEFTRRPAAAAGATSQAEQPAAENASERDCAVTCAEAANPRGGAASPSGRAGHLSRG